MKKKKKQVEKKQIEKKEQVIVDKVGIDVYFSIMKIIPLHRAGMLHYKEAHSKKMTINEWKDFFKSY